MRANLPCPDSEAAYHRAGGRHPTHRRPGRAPLPRGAAPAHRAPVARAGPRRRPRPRSHAWARSSSTPSVWRVATTTWCSTRGCATTSPPGPTTLLYGTRELFETYNKGLSLLPTAELPWYRVGWDVSSEYRSGVLSRHEQAVAAHPGTHPPRGTLEQPRLRAEAGHRLVVGSHERGTGAAGGAVRLGHPGALTPGWQPALLRPHGAADAPGAAGRCGPASTTSAGTSCCRAIEPTDCWVPPAPASCGSAPARADASRRGPARDHRAWRAARRVRGRRRPHPGRHRGAARVSIHPGHRGGDPRPRRSGGDPPRPPR